ncbi:MAG: hypothetical protein GTO63_36975, partial [Anaerolineae bacterium]|nr:hypothetical protein [Anaerolineae bacterium]NIQ83127.1 hypothetical protein [Anaerolineae bacterium]
MNNDSPDLTQEMAGWLSSVTDSCVSAEIKQIFGGDLLEATEGPRTDLQHFASLTDWVLTLILVGIRHAIPDLTNEDAVKVANALARTIHLPGQAHHWTIAKDLINRHGMRAAVSRIMLELQRERMKV